MWRNGWLTALALLLGLLSGCSGSGERGKNKNLDRPAAGTR